LLGGAANKQVHELGFINNRIVTVKATDTALNSFKVMNDSKISAAPIVDQQGHFIATLSVSDLKGLTAETFDTLLGSTQAFAERHSVGPHPPLVCSPTDTFGYAISMIGLSRVHRVWILNADKHPVGVITLTDICRTAHSLVASSQ